MSVEDESRPRGQVRASAGEEIHACVGAKAVAEREEMRRVTGLPGRKCQTFCNVWDR